MNSDVENIPIPEDEDDVPTRLQGNGPSNYTWAFWYPKTNAIVIVRKFLESDARRRAANKFKEMSLPTQSVVKRIDPDKDLILLKTNCIKLKDVWNGVLYTGKLTVGMIDAKKSGELLLGIRKDFLKGKEKSREEVRDGYAAYQRHLLSLSDDIHVEKLINTTKNYDEMTEDEKIQAEIDAIENS